MIPRGWIVLIGAIASLLVAGGLVWSLSVSKADQQSDVRRFGDPATVAWPANVYCTTEQAVLTCDERESRFEHPASFDLVATYNYAQVGQPFRISELTTEADKNAIVCEPPAGSSLRCARLPNDRTLVGEVAMYWG